jgi:PEP-CTERM motif
MSLRVRFVALAALVFAVGSPARADLIGTTVTGTLAFNDIPTNYFDPANNNVPSTGYLNSADAFDSPTVVISLFATTYGFEDAVQPPANLDTANFSATQLTVTDTVFTRAVTWTMTFSDTAFTSITNVSDDFVNGGVSASLSGDVITLIWAGTSTSSGDVPYTAVFDVNVPPSVPEPNTLIVAGIGIFAGLIFASRHRLRHSFPRSAWECSPRRSASS